MFEEGFRKMLAALVPPTEWDSGMLDLHRTPGRVFKAYKELLSSYVPGADRRLRREFRTFPNELQRAGIVTEGPIPYSSLCAHHLLPFMGDAFIGYLPRKRIAGLSKIPRAVEHFSHKLQLQEKLGSDIADFLEERLKPQAIVVVLRGRHLCMEIRGVRKPGVITRTAEIRGLAIDDTALRQEFYSLLG